MYIEGGEVEGETYQVKRWFHLIYPYHTMVLLLDGIWQINIPTPTLLFEPLYYILKSAKMLQVLSGGEHKWLFMGNALGLFIEAVAGSFLRDVHYHRSQLTCSSHY